MRRNQLWQGCFFFVLSIVLGGCATHPMSDATPISLNSVGSDLPLYHGEAPYSASFDEGKYAELLPQNVAFGREKVILVDPKKFAWGAYDEHGKLVHAGIASAGADFCKDEGRPCHTAVGTFRIYSLGNADCISKTYPLGEGGSYMPYCMFFHDGESLHGSPDQMLGEANISHGCVHMRIPDVAWLRYNFAQVGTKVVVLPY